MKFFCICLARGGSKGLPGKNIKSLNGKPLIAYTIEAALNTSEIDEIFVSSDSKEILDIAKTYGANTLIRPDELASDEATSDDAIWYHLNEASQNRNFDGVILLQPTSPLRRSEDIIKAIELFKKQNKTVFSVSELDVSPYRSYLIEEGHLKPLFDETNASRRQDETKTYAANGAIYIFNCKDFLTTKRIPRKDITPYIMEKKRSIDIDDLIDFKLAEFTMTGDHT